MFLAYCSTNWFLIGQISSINKKVIKDFVAAEQSFEKTRDTYIYIYTYVFFLFFFSRNLQDCSKGSFQPNTNGYKGKSDHSRQTSRDVTGRYRHKKLVLSMKYLDFINKTIKTVF